MPPSFDGITYGDILSNLFHFLSVTLNFLMPLHKSPEPSITPSPVIATFWAFSIVIGEIALILLIPSYSVKWSGYSSYDLVNLMKASFSKWKLILDLILIGPVK